MQNTVQAPPQLSSKLQFLVACCKAEPTPADIDLINDHLTSIANYESLITLSGRQGVIPLVYKSLKKLSDANLLHQEPSERNTLISELKSAYMHIARRNMLLCAELLKVVKLLENNGTTSLAFKGPALAQLAYGDITQRTFSDLDVLIHRRDFRRLARQMVENGYAPAFPIETFKGDRVMFDMNNDCPFYDYDRGLSIEIHWDFFRKLALPTEQFAPWEETESVVINGTPIRTLRHETHLLYHSLHGSKHIWERLNWIVDIDRFIRNVPDLDWEWIVAKAQELGALRMFLFGPALAQHFFDTPLPEKIGKLCEEAHFEDLIGFVISEFNRPDPTPEDSLVKLKKVIALRDSFYYRSLTLMEFLFRPGINERRTVVLPDALFWLYWPLRPLGMGFRLLFCRMLKLCVPNKERPRS